MSANMGHQALMGTRAEVTYGTAAGATTEGFVFVSNSVRRVRSILPRDGIRGFRDEVSTDTREGTDVVSGQIVLEPTPEDLAIWLPRILGGTPSGTAYAVAETLPSFTHEIKRHAGTKGMATHTGCKVSRATFSCAQGQLMRLAMDIVGQDETLATGSGFPSLTPTVTQPYVMHDFALTLVSATREFSSFNLVIDNQLDAGRFMNSRQITNLPEGGRLVTLSTTHDDNTTNADLLDQALAGVTGTLVATNGAYSTTFTFGILQVPAETPGIEGRGAIDLTLNMTARRTGTTPSIAVTHDSTP